MRGVWLLVIACVVVVALWRVGEAHKQTCIREGKLGCSILPWSGNAPGAGVGTGGGSGGGLVQGVGSSVQGVGAGVAGSFQRSGAGIP
jgi:hypothetical protein